MVFIVVPAMLIKIIAQKIEHYINKKAKICIVPGSGGGECAFKNSIKKGITIFGIQRVPSVARLIQYFESRYFTADFAYGLSILVQIAKYVNVEVAHMSEILEWYFKLTMNKNIFYFSDYGIESLNQLVCIYLK